MTDASPPVPRGRQHDRYGRGLILPGIAVLILTPLIILGVIIGLHRSFSEAEAIRDLINRSYEERLQLETVFSLVQDCETGQRGFIITGQKSFLGPYQSCRRDLAAARQRLRELVGRDEFGEASSQASMAALSRLDELVDAKLENSQRNIELKAGGGDAVAAVASGEGKRIMDQIRNEVAFLKSTEAAALTRRLAEDARNTATNERVVIGALLVLGSLLLVSFLMVLTQLRQRQVLLRRARQASDRHLAIFESATDALITFNSSGSIESINRAGEAMFGYKRAELSRRDVGLLLDLPETDELFMNRLLGAAAPALGGSQIYVARRRGGESFPAEVSLGRFELQGDDFVVCSIRDVTERQRVERLKSEFVSTVSHELRSPLTSIAGSLGLLVGGAAGALPERAARLLTIAHGNCQRLVRLINDILDIEKLESGQMAFSWTSLDLGELVHRSAEGLGGLAAETGVELRVTASSGMPPVRGDADRLAQVLWNLISNGLKFSPAGATVEVDVGVNAEGWARLAVRDHGPGIPAAFRERIFSRFAQADGSDTRAKGGTGLGLAITRQIVERHQGRIWFESEPGNGAAFFVELPPMSVQEAVAAPPAPPAADGLAGPRPLVLHVDDDADVRELVASALSPWCEVMSAASLGEARDVLRQESPVLAILDIALSDGSGLALRPLLSRAKGATVPVVVFSAQAAPEELSRDVAAVLTKSRASLDHLVQTVLATLARQVAQQEQP